MGCKYSHDDFKQANDINELFQTWNSNEKYFFKVLTESGTFPYLKNDIAELHSNIYDILLKIQFDAISFEFKEIKNKLISYAESLNTQNKDIIDKNLKDLNKIVETVEEMK